MFVIALFLALLPASTALVLLVWTRRALVASDKQKVGVFLVQIVLGLSTMLLLPSLVQSAVWNAEQSVTQRLVRAPMDEGRAIAADVGAWKCAAGWGTFAQEIRQEIRRARSVPQILDESADARVEHLLDCYQRLTGQPLRRY